MKKKIIIILIICATILVGIYFYIQITEKQNKKFRVTFLNVGQGDSALIRFADGKKMLVDCGIDNRILNELGKNLPFYDRNIDILLTTHPDADHYGGCPEVMKRYHIGKIVSNGDESKAGDPYWTVWTKYAAASGAPMEIMMAPAEWDIAGAHFNFLTPDESLSVEPKKYVGNNRSIVFQLSYDNKSFLFTGDMETPLEDALLFKYCSTTPVNCPELHADYLKVGHHGSDTASGENFLEAVASETAVISVGKNTFGHPSFRVLNHLRRANAEIWRTDELGDIIVE